MALQATTKNGNESLRLPHPCALAVARDLLNTTRSPKLRYKATWEYRDEKNISNVRCDRRGSGNDGSRTGTDRRRAGKDGNQTPSSKSAVRHFRSRHLARA